MADSVGLRKASGRDGEPRKPLPRKGVPPPRPRPKIEKLREVSPPSL